MRYLSLSPVAAFGPLLSRLALAATVEIRDGQTGIPITFPPQPMATVLKQIPDHAHPFIEPGPKDQRGPARNPLANHVYIPRNGIATFEEITVAMVEAFNIEINFGAFLAAPNMLLRGNPFVNKVSIGGVSPLVPPLPGNIGSAQTGGIAPHGGIEGDASITRADVHIGDNQNFQDTLYDLDLLQLGKFGDNGPDGNNTIFDIPALIAIKQQNIRTNQAAVQFEARVSYPGMLTRSIYGEARDRRV